MRKKSVLQIKSFKAKAVGYLIITKLVLFRTAVEKILPNSHARGCYGQNQELEKK